MEIRLLSENDHLIFDAAVRKFRQVELTDHTAFLVDPATIAFAALDRDTVIGWAWGHRQRHAGGFSQVQLYEIEVAASWRRRGVGRALLAQFLQLARDEGHARMWLFTDNDNTPALGLYTGMGGHPAPHDDATFWWQLEPTDQAAAC
ncbi:N-acetyltransferase family protein [Pseudonocardia sp. RS010]|uniref:GNAT family N-acetyltransferase n=1 Tax=Pseudonocardia sp. RS010 TaxID=3385979 RepID=UPI0039A1022B